MKTNNIYEENNKLILVPSNYKMLYWILILILILLFPIFLYIMILIINQIIETIKDFNLSHLNDISDIQWMIVLFYLFILLGFNIIRIARKFIPKKIIINKNMIELVYKNTKTINISMDLWQYIYTYRLKSRQSKHNYFGLFNSIKNIQFELYESNKENLSQIIDFFKKNTKLKYLEQTNIKPSPILQNKIFSSEYDEILIQNRNRKHLISFFVDIIIYFIFLIIVFLSQKEFDKISQWDWINILILLISILQFIFFFVLILISIFKLFFNLKIVKDKNKLMIYYDFFISSIPIRIKRKEFIFNQNFSSNLNLFYDRKISFIEIFDLKEHYPPSLWKKLLKIKYFKIQLFGYYVDEVLEIYNQFIKILKT